MLNERVAQFEERLAQKTNWVLKNNTLVRDFQKFRQEAQVKNWQAVHKYQKEELASNRLQLSEIQQQNKNLTAEV